MKLWIKIQLGVVVLFQLGLSEKLVGVIETAQEDKNYNPTEINLMVDKVVKGKLTTYYYQIKKGSGKGQELFQHVDKKVEVTGMIRKGKKGKRSIIVTGFKLLEPEEEEIPSDSVDEEHLKPLNLDGPEEAVGTGSEAPSSPYSGY